VRPRLGQSMTNRLVTEANTGLLSKFDSWGRSLLTLAPGPVDKWDLPFGSGAPEARL